MTQRVVVRLKELFDDPNYISNLRAMKQSGELNDLLPLPDNYLGWDMDQNTPYHNLTVWEHTLLALTHLNIILDKHNVSGQDKFLCNVAVLLHDTGKLNPAIHGTKDDHKGRRTTYYNHEKYSAQAAEEMLGGFFTINEVDTVKLLIRGSSAANPNYVAENESCNLSDKSLRRFADRLKEWWELAIYINMADSSSKEPCDFSDFTFTYHYDMMKRIQNPVAQNSQGRLLLSGNEIVKIIGRKPGPWISQVVGELLKWQSENPNANHKEAETFIASINFN